MAKLIRYLFLIFLLIFIVTFFTRNNVRGVGEIAPDVLRPPLQQELSPKKPFTFVKDDYEYRLSPLYYYSISGIVVSKINYKRFSIYKESSAFPIDLCMIWGDNAKTRVHQNRGVKFSQDCRWCWVDWQGNVNFNLAEISNSHLLVNNKDLERVMNALVVGDQIKIRGKLVDVDARPLGKVKQGSLRDLSWSTSTIRTDQGAGACEVIYVDDIKILKKANVISRSLFLMSMYGLIALAVFSGSRFLWSLFAS
ncbi:MAG: hypothetical protein JSW40_08690 [Candidatus Omnitrophota bacterium]|nr:MAG: hypothetical protein JSW40_08690 [Candidatus Omnitrophota bacterium]